MPPGARDDLIRRISLLKRNAMAAPFEQAFDEFAELQEQASKFTSEQAPQGVREGGEVRAIHYREEEAIYIKASHDRVTVIFSTVFREETDRIFGKVFLQVFHCTLGNVNVSGISLIVCFYRNLWTLAGELFRMPPKYFFVTTLHSSSKMFPAFPLPGLARLVTLPSVRLFSPYYAQLY